MTGRVLVLGEPFPGEAAVPDGVQRRAVSGVDEAVAVLESLERIDCLVCRVPPPDGDGVELIHESTDRWPDLPLVAVAVDGDVTDAIEAGATHLVPERRVRDHPTLLARQVRTAAEAGQWRRVDGVGEGALTRLHEATRDLMRAGTPAEVASVGVEAASDIIGFQLTTCFLYDDAEDLLVPVANTGKARDIFGEPPTFEPGQGITGDAFASGTVEAHADGQADERADPRGSSRIRSFVAVPLGDHGVLTAVSPAVAAYDEADLEGLNVLAANVEVALERAERERQLAERERELSRKNDRLESFTELVTHDLRGPLTVAQGHLELAAADCDHDSLAEIDRALDRMTSLIHEVLTLSRQGETVGTTETVPLARAARDAWETVDTADADLSVEASGTVDAHPERLRTLFENLFRNGVDHGGQAVEVQVEDLPDADGFAVADDGSGVPEAARGDLFERGFTTHEDGTGLGLDIVESIVQAHGWTIQLDHGDGESTGDGKPAANEAAHPDGARFVVRTGDDPTSEHKS
jgi:signal transduction histidine kinase